VRHAIDLMVQRGLKRGDAAEAAGLKEHSLYVALRHSHVKAYYLEQCEILRLAIRARGIHRMDEVMHQSDNLTACVAAYKALRDDGEQVGRNGTTVLQSPGMIVSIVNHIAAAATQPQHAAEQPTISATYSRAADMLSASQNGPGPAPGGKT
jgi:hypothetical protein